MNKPVDAADYLVTKAGEDSEFRGRLLANPRGTIETEFGVTLAQDHEIHVHEETYAATHVVLPPRSKFSDAERAEAKTGAASLAFLRKTLHDPAPPARPPALERTTVGNGAATVEALAAAGRGRAPRRGVGAGASIGSCG